MRNLPSVSLLIAAAALSWANAAAPPADNRDAHDLVLLHEHRPYRFRLHLRLAGRPYGDQWNRQVDRLFDFLDVDRDGRLSPQEAGRAPSLEQWRQLASGTPSIDPDPRPDFRLLAQGKSHAQREDLRRYYSATSAGPLQMHWDKGRNKSDPAGDALWQRLDHQRVGKLTRKQIEDAPRVLGKLDQDDNEVLTRAEVLGLRGASPEDVMLSLGAAHGLASGGLPFFSFRPQQQPQQLSRALLKRYDRDGSQSLSREEFRLPAPQFTRLDADGNGVLDLQELDAWVELPADVQLLVALDRWMDPIQVHLADKEKLRCQSRGRHVSLQIEGWLIEWSSLAGLATANPNRTVIHQQAFRTLDRDADGFVSVEEIQQPPFTFVSWMRLADRNGDERLSEQEFRDFADLCNSIQGQLTILQVYDLQRSLFRLLDADGDGRLSPRELQYAWPRLKPWSSPEGTLARNQLPTHYRIAMGYGLLMSSQGASPQRMLERERRVLLGPLWFQKMDRNGDGEVSRKEWLGSAEQFGDLDTDGDGFVSVSEAEKADRVWRRSAKPGSQVSSPRAR